MDLSGTIFRLQRIDVVSISVILLDLVGGTDVVEPQ